MGRPRRLKDDAVTLKEFTALFNATLDATIPCQGGMEWTSDDPVLQRRAAELCGYCSLLEVCRQYALAAGERKGVWGGLTALQRKKLRRRQREAA